MPLSFLFWLLMVLWLFFGVVPTWPADRNFRPFGGSLLLFVLIGMLGWKVFGEAIHS